MLWCPRGPPEREGRAVQRSLWSESNILPRKSRRNLFRLRGEITAEGTPWAAAVGPPELGRVLLLRLRAAEPNPLLRCLAASRRFRLDVLSPGRSEEDELFQHPG